ncbi:hypothetical protein Tco_0746410 [Tanacetum coccineum]
MSSASSTVTYTSVDTDSEPGRAFWPADEELSDGGSEDPQAPLVRPVMSTHLHLLMVPYVPEPEYPSYVADCRSDMRIPKEDPEEDLLNYHADKGDGDDKPSDDDDVRDDTDNKDEEPFEDEEEEYLALFEDEEEEHLDLADSSAIPVVDHVPSAGDIEEFETDEEDIPEAELPPRKRLCLTAPTLRYEVGESSTASPRPIGGHRADYGFIGTIDAEIRRQRAEEVGYGFRDVWVDLTEAVEEVAPTTLEGVNARVTELAAVQEQDTHDIYAVIEETQDRQTQLFQRVDGLVEDRQFHYETARLLDQEALVSREAWAHSVGLSLTGQLSAALGQIQALQARDQTHADDPEGAASTAVGLVFSFLVSDNHNNMPPRRSSATARAAAATAATPMTVAAVKQLIEARVSTKLANHETLRNSTNGQGDESHNSDTRIRGTIRTPRECTYKDFLNASPYFKGIEGVTVTQDVAYAMDRKAPKKMMTVKYCPRGEIKKLEIELWNLKGKCKCLTTKTMEKQLRFANDQMDQKVLTITKRQVEQKRSWSLCWKQSGAPKQNKQTETLEGLHC